MAHLQFTLHSGRRVGLSTAGSPVASRLVVFCGPTPSAGEFDPEPRITDDSDVRVITLDRPGYGASDPLSGTPTIEQFADDVAEYLSRSEGEARQLDGTRYGRVGVVGWSFGGAVALTLAARHPQLIGRVATIGMPLPARLQHGDLGSGVIELRPLEYSTVVKDISEYLPDEPPEPLSALGVSDDDPALRRPGMRERLSRMVTDSYVRGPRGIATDRVAARDTAWSGELRKVRAETLLIYGENDPVASRADGAWYRRHVRGSRLVTVAGAGRLAIVSSWKRILDFAGGAQEQPAASAHR